MFESMDAVTFMVPGSSPNSKHLYSNNHQTTRSITPKIHQSLRTWPFKLSEGIDHAKKLSSAASLDAKVPRQIAPQGCRAYSK